MKRKMFFTFLVVLLSLTTSLYSSGQKEDSKRITESGLDISDTVELQFWMLGNAPKDLKLIEDEINKMALEELNCTVKFNYTTWTDWSQKYQLLLTSGQQVDLMFTAEWTDYQMYARSGAFLELEDILPVAAPELNKFISDVYWDAVKVGGSIYTMPNTWKEYVYDGFEYREDLRKKYNLPEINSIETIEAYLDGIRANEPDMMPLGETVAGSQFAAITSLTAELLHPWLDRGMPKYGLASNNDTPSIMFNYWGTAEHLADLKMFKRWADKGFWSRSILSSTEDVSTLFREGRLAAKMAGINPNKFASDVLNIGTNHPDWEVGYFPFSKASGIVHPVHPTHNGYAVPISSKNPERAVAFFEKMILDKRYNRLTNYGIEGTHFVEEDGYYKMVGDQSTNGFGREAMNGWAWRNPDFMLFDPSFDPVKELFADFDTFSTPDLFNGFAEDYTPYQTERSALLQAQAEYLVQIQAGLVDNVEEGLAIFMNAADIAGLDKIQAEYIKQWAQYCKEMEIK